jgi:hypothetical protein
MHGDGVAARRLAVRRFAARDQGKRGEDRENARASRDRTAPACLRGSCPSLVNLPAITRRGSAVRMGW